MTALSALRRIGTIAPENAPLATTKGGTGANHANAAALIAALLGVTPGAFGLTQLDDTTQGAGQTTLGYTAADVLAKLLGVDGAGSLLDADTVDGLQASAFAQLAAANTFTQRNTSTYPGSGWGFTHLNETTSGSDAVKIGFKSYNGGAPKKWAVGAIQGALSSFGISEDSYPDAGAGTAVMTIAAGGNTTFSGTVSMGSDRKLKSDIEPLSLEWALNFVGALQPKSFRKGGDEMIGFIAQEMPDRRYVLTVENEDPARAYLAIPAGAEWAAPLALVVQDLMRRLDALEVRP